MRKEVKEWIIEGAEMVLCLWWACLVLAIACAPFIAIGLWANGKL